MDSFVLDIAVVEMAAVYDIVSIRVFKHCFGTEANLNDFGQTINKFTSGQGIEEVEVNVDS